MTKVTVTDAIKAMEKAVAELKELPPTMEVMGNFDQGGYTDEPMTLNSFNIGVEPVTDEELDEDYEPDDPDRPKPNVTVVAKFY